MKLIPQILREKKELENNNFQVISFYSNWEIINKSEIENNEINLYFWELSEKNPTFYTEEFIIWAIKSSLNSSNENINITLGWKLKQIMNFEISNNSTSIDIDNQKKYLKKLINENFLDEKNRIKIDLLEDNHSSLLNKLDAEDWFKTDELDLEALKNKEELSSLDIYNLLFLESQQNEKLFKLIVNTQTKHIKEKRNERSSYYWLAEVAIRLKDLIDWREIQWWENRQKRYDVIINQILNKEFNFENLEILYKYLDNKKINSNKFKQIYIKKDELEKENRNTIDLKNIKKKINTLIFTTFTSVSLILWWYWYKTYEYKQEKKERLDKLKQNDINKIWWYNVDSIVENIRNKMNFEDKVVKYCISKYSLWEFKDENELKLYIRDAINSYEIEKRLMYNYWDYPKLKSEEEYFLYDFNKILEKIKYSLTEKWMNLDSKYWRFDEYKKEIEKTLSVDSSKIKFLWRQFVTDLDNIYSPKLWEMEVWIIRCQQQWATPWTNLSICKWIKWRQSFFWARKSWTKGKFSLDLWKQIALELKK